MSDMVQCVKCCKEFDKFNAGYFFPAGDQPSIPEAFTDKHFCDDCGGVLAKRYGWMHSAGDTVAKPPVEALPFDEAFLQVNRLWLEALKEYGGLSEIAGLLSKAAWQIRDARDLAKTGLAKRVECVRIKSGTHAVGENPYSPLCGAWVEFSERVYPMTSVPDCPACIRLLKEREVQP